MDEGGEDRISNLPDEVACHILSRLPAKEFVRTSVLSKDWEHKWTSIYNIQTDSSTEKYNNGRALVRIVERIGLPSPENMNNVEINANTWRGGVFTDHLYNPRSLKELRLNLHCTLTTSLVMKLSPNLKILYLSDGVKLLNDKICNTNEVLLNFPVLEELELIKCEWQRVKLVVINAPELIRFLSEGSDGSLRNDYLIKINGANLRGFKSCGDILENVVFTAPSILNAAITNRGGIATLEPQAHNSKLVLGHPILYSRQWERLDATLGLRAHHSTPVLELPIPFPSQSELRDATLGSRAHAILRGFSTLVHLKLSSDVAKALTKSNKNLLLLHFSWLKQLEFSDINNSDGALRKLLQVMPSLESLVLYVNNRFVGWEYLPSGIASRFKVVKLVDFRGAPSHIRLATSILKNAENLEKLIVAIGDRPLMPKIDIKSLLLSLPKSSTNASIVFMDLKYAIFLRQSTQPNLIDECFWPSLR